MQNTARHYLALLLIPPILVLALSGCGSVRETFGMDQTGPDEFDVTTAPPLSIPPDFTLRPPEPGAPRPQVANPQNTARELLTGAGSETGDVTVPSAAPTTAVETDTTASGAEDNLLSNLGGPRANAAPAAPAAGSLGTLTTEVTGGVDNPVATTLDENARVQAILEAPVTRNEEGKLPAIEMEDKDGAFWDSWF